MLKSDDKKGDAAGQVKELAKACYAPLLRYALSLARDENLARDAVQESFLKFLNAARNGNIEHPKAWLFTVCRNKIFDELKRCKRYSEADENVQAFENAEKNPRANAEIQDNLKRVLELSERLSDREREAIRLKFQCGFSYSQIAQIMSISENNAGVTLHKALKNLRSMFFEKTATELKHS